MKKTIFIIAGLFMAASCYADGSGFADKKIARNVSLDTSAFNNNLTANDNNVQTALETLDDLVAGVSGSGFVSADTNVLIVDAMADDQILVADGVTSATARTLTNCTDSGGNHLNYTQATNSFSCGTTSSGSGGWTDGGTDVTLSTSTDNVGIGGASLGKLSVDGDTDETQLLVQGNATQTSNIFVVENSAGTDIVSVATTGMTIAGSGTPSVAINGATSGTTTVIATAVAGTTTLTLPAATDTLVGKATTDTFTNKTLTAARIADLGFIADANGNEAIIVDTVTSAVNELTVANSATGGNTKLSATGGDTDIDVEIATKGEGGLILTTSATVKASTITAGLTVNNGGTGVGANEDFIVKTNVSDTAFVIDASAETITSGLTGSMGWVIVDQTDNQACNTGCTSACVFGIDNATGSAVTNLVSCSATTADLCLCAGAS